MHLLYLSGIEKLWFNFSFPIFKCSQTIIKTIFFLLAYLVKNLLFLVTVVYWRKIWILHGANLMASNLLYIKYFQICLDLTITFFFYKIKLNFGTKQLWMGIYRILVPVITCFTNHRTLQCLLIIVFKNTIYV